MKKSICSLSLLCLLAGCSTLPKPSQTLDVADIQKYKIQLPENLIKASEGFYPGIGSGLTFHQKDAKGHLQFYSISDRGPNFSYGEHDIVSFAPAFTPVIVHVDVTPGAQAQALDYLPIKKDGKLISGLNPSTTETDEVIYDTKLTRVHTTFGLDTESIGILANGNFVVGDEYAPSINIIDHQTGDIIHRLTPGNGLPEILKYRNHNKGFEALTVAPNGKIYALLEGVILPQNDAPTTNHFIRMVEVDLETKSTRMLAYAFDPKMYKSSQHVKIGDLAAIDNENFLLVEQGNGSTGDFSNLIFKINIAQATDISHMDIPEGEPLEQSTTHRLEQITPIHKELIFNPRHHGWTEKKLEGLAYVDPYTIALTNDNDFGLIGHDVTGTTHKTITPKVDPAKQETNLWVIRFKNKIHSVGDPTPQ